MPQMTAQVSFVTAYVSDVIVAPLAALTAIPEKRGYYGARILQPDGRLESRQVRLGVRNRRVAEITGGLNEGEALIVAEQADERHGWLQW
jgi:macrolide-specific efflux system membrane fusion protein